MLSSSSDSERSGSQPKWISVTAAIMIGPISNIFRTASVFGCQELEEYSPGSAGVIGNIINASYIPISAVYAYLLFDEVMTPFEFIGAAVVAFAILFVTCVKMARQIRAEGVRMRADGARKGDDDDYEKEKGKEFEKDDSYSANQDEKVSLLKNP